jgi:hypothetical protein
MFQRARRRLLRWIGRPLEGSAGVRKTVGRCSIPSDNSARFDAPPHARIGAQPKKSGGLTDFCAQEPVSRVPAAMASKRGLEMSGGTDHLPTESRAPANPSPAVILRMIRAGRALHSFRIRMSLIVPYIRVGAHNTLARDLSEMSKAGRQPNRNKRRVPGSVRAERSEPKSNRVDASRTKLCMPWPSRDC